MVDWQEYIFQLFLNFYVQVKPRYLRFVTPVPYKMNIKSNVPGSMDRNIINTGDRSRDPIDKTTDIGDGL